MRRLLIGAIAWLIPNVTNGSTATSVSAMPSWVIDAVAPIGMPTTIILWPYIALLGLILLAVGIVIIASRQKVIRSVDKNNSDPLLYTPVPQKDPLPFF